MGVASNVRLAAVQEQQLFYHEVAKGDRIYVFASPSRYQTFVRSDGADIGPAIERPGYGPGGETVVFDSRNAINLYNFKHGLAGENFPSPRNHHNSDFPPTRSAG
jgi:hypothetical protein